MWIHFVPKTVLWGKELHFSELMYWKIHNVYFNSLTVLGWMLFFPTFYGTKTPNFGLTLLTGTNSGIYSEIYRGTQMSLQNV